MAGARKPKSEIAPKLHKDPLKEYADAVGGDGVHAVSLLDESCASNVRCWVPTGSLALDRLLNGRGVPCSRITEIYGPQHLGKSTILDQMFAQVQHMGGFGVLVDTEAARDKGYVVRGLGVDPDKLKSLEFDSPTDVNIESIANKIIETVDFWRMQFFETPIVLGWDSLGGTTTRSEIGKEVGERNVAAAAKAMRDMMRKVTMRVARSNVALVVINHQYTNINTMGGRPASRETYGGQALRLAATLRIELFHKGIIKQQDGAVIGREVGVRLDKNKLGRCLDTRVAILNGRGTDNVWTLYESFKERGALTVSGSWSTLRVADEQIKFQGWSGLAEKCTADPELFTRLVAAYEESV